MSSFKTVVLAMLLGSSALTSPSHAAETAAQTSAIRSTVSPEAARTQTLLDRAESHLREKGDQAMASFSRAGEFVDGESSTSAFTARPFLVPQSSSVTTRSCVTSTRRRVR